MNYQGLKKIFLESKIGVSVAPAVENLQIKRVPGRWKSNHLLFRHTIEFATNDLCAMTKSVYA